MKNNLPAKQSDFLLYTGSDGKVNVEVFLKDETVWLTQKAMAELFGCTPDNISLHLKNIYKEKELDTNSTTEDFSVVQKEGKRQVSRKMEFYNLDAIIAVGYRVNSYQATRFRIWATKILKEYIIKGFVLDDERLKQGSRVFGKDYFEELLERIREIRASERRFYQKITDIYALSADYDRNAPLTKEFFATVQNKLHWAITGKTAAEIIYDSADATKIYMGLTSWKHAPEGKILKSDVAVAKNYLSEAHIKELNQIVSAYLDLAENRANRQIVTKMEEWAHFLHGFLEFSNYPILKDKGRVSALEAKIKAEQEYEQFRVIQDKNFISDFDKEIKRITGKNDDD
ncbi:MAG: cell filamentation protein Fic [Deltaproteobacteria bacterium CG12_big_fil_rev_8_21_14_0_65_43_10]|nr:MAG: cell filamentation protein Fic [Deltaproteobacteria bacterium CG2_30_43_15]PIQ45372.1 MAG: cell filamentation protein Fic [Deltaproteobacteria bacterium CG12_big_fil_rev_8_21_14_0_65_43_10]PIU86624.1 MAG: cell filamentation protein Fic [Deltaproteobacteria bacterium CG06_land_8_20_14_3_00_44_19]PIZ20132.1 MAG: cell filamentation protein Fic [Deltaproteobacteria bacterium CG_4_10_14_0_8_um_filter_43_12]HCX89021.1 cell filamentation protein Fic [Deltaproteobacteria bacterium]